MNLLQSLLEWIMKIIYGGGYVFKYFESNYIKNFDSKIRMKTDRIESDLPDWENSEVVGRNRRSAHTVLKSFTSKAHSLQYWSTITQQPDNKLKPSLKHILPNCSLRLTS
jgi:hypothetical protein